MAPESGGRTPKLPKRSFWAVNGPTRRTIENGMAFIVASMTSEQDLMSSSLIVDMAFFAPWRVVRGGCTLGWHKSAICEDYFVGRESNLKGYGEEDQWMTLGLPNEGRNRRIDVVATGWTS